MGFYKSCFGGTIEFMTVAESPMAKDMPDKQDYIMHSTLKSKDFVLIGSDMMRDKAVIGDNMNLMVDCKDKAEVDSLFDKMAEGGEPFMKPEDTFWGGYFGVVTDKYGVEWSFHFQANPKK